MNNVHILSLSQIASPTPNKPVELYIFIDPLCPKAFQMQSLIRKLQVDFDHYFTWRYVLSTELASLNCLNNRTKGCFSGDELDITHPVLPFIAVKTAELQGKRAGTRYLTKLQEYAVVYNKNVNSYATLLEIAEEIQLDMIEFKADFGSKEATRAFQCDLYITREMEVSEVPSIVFFNECIEDEGLKVSGHYDYKIYTHILEELLNEKLTHQPLPSLAELFGRFHTLTTQEVSFIYSISEQQAECELKKCMLQQKIERIQTKDYTIWRNKKSASAHS